MAQFVLGSAGTWQQFCPLATAAVSCTLAFYAPTTEGRGVRLSNCYAKKPPGMPMAGDGCHEPTGSVATLGPSRCRETRCPSPALLTLGPSFHSRSQLPWPGTRVGCRGTAKPPVRMCSRNQAGFGQRKISRENAMMMMMMTTINSHHFPSAAKCHTLYIQAGI